MWLISTPIHLFIALIAAIIFIFEIWMFVDCIQNERLSSTEKLLWCLGMLFIHPFVAIIYYFVARRSRRV